MSLDNPTQRKVPDETTAAIQHVHKRIDDLYFQMDEIKANSKKAHERLQRLDVFEEQMRSLSRNVEKLVTRHEFDPVKLLVYGIAGSALCGIVGALLSTVLLK